MTETTIRLHFGQYWLFVQLIKCLFLEFQLEEFLKALISIE